MAPAADLLTSWGTLVLAEREDWPERAQVIGRLLRDMMEGESVETFGDRRPEQLDISAVERLCPYLVPDIGGKCRQVHSLDAYHGRSNDIQG